MNKNSFVVRTMKREELDVVLDWAKMEGWNPGLYDADCFYKADHHGFFIGLLGDEQVSCISAVAYNEQFGFIGLYIVKPEFRGKGYGLQTWQKAFGYLTTQNIGLDGVVAQQENYKKSGFTLAYRNIRYQGRSKKYETDFHMKKAIEVSFEKLCRYDRTCFPAPRERFLRCWINQPESRSLATFDENGELTGFGVIRKCKNGYKIGPLFADNKVTAQSLFATLNNSIKEGVEIFLDTPETNTAALNLAKENGMTYVFETARMYTKNQPDINIKKVFGVTTFELG